jgi:hemoglobin-like flavoprotein
MRLKEGDKLLIVHRRLSGEDNPRFFVGAVNAYEVDIAKAVGNSFLRDMANRCGLRDECIDCNPIPLTRLLPSFEDIVDIAESIQQILSREEVVTDLFYRDFLDRHPEVREFFLGVNLHHQAAVLRMSLALIERHYQQVTPAMREYLKVLGHRHALRKIPVAYYAGFRDCLVETLCRFHGADWTNDLEKEWRVAIDAATEAMLQGYSGPAVY